MKVTNGPEREDKREKIEKTRKREVERWEIKHHSVYSRNDLSHKTNDLQ